jgi:ATP-dependent DNA ligase
MSFSLRERKKLLEKVVNEVEGKLEIVKYKVVSKYEDIQK